jgi:hypothetical protein
MEHDEARNPVDMSVLGAQAAMFEANPVAHAIEQSSSGTIDPFHVDLRHP